MLTSPRLYQALLQETFRLNSPKRLLLVGAQIPELALKLINSLSKGDELTIIEGLSTQLSSLRQRLEQEPAFIKHQGQITFSTQLLWELDRPHYFQAIILSYPIDLLSDEMLQRSLEACANLLREGGTVTDLKNYLGVTHQTAQGLVRRLAEKGLLESSRSPQDGRCQVLSITPAGREAAGRMIQSRERTGDKLFHGMSTGERQEFLRLLTIAYENVRDD